MSATGAKIYNFLLEGGSGAPSVACATFPRNLQHKCSCCVSCCMCVACVLHVKSAQLMDHRDNHYQCMQISSRNGTKSSSSKIDVSCELSKNGK